MVATGTNGVTNESNPATPVNSTSNNTNIEPITKNRNSISNNPISPSTSIAASTTAQVPPKGIMNTSGTSGAIVSNTPSGIRKIPTVTFSDPKKVVVTPLQQHIQQHKEQQRELKEQKEQQRELKEQKEQQRELKEQKEQQKNELKGQKANTSGLNNEDIDNDAKKILHQKQKNIIDNMELGAKANESILQKDTLKSSPVSFQLVSPTGSSGSLTSSNVNSLKDGESYHLEKNLAKEPFFSNQQPQGTLRKDTITSESGNIKFQIPQRTASFKEHSQQVSSPLKNESTNNVSGREGGRSSSITNINNQKLQSPLSSVATTSTTNDGVGAPVVLSTSSDFVPTVSNTNATLENETAKETSEPPKTSEIMNLCGKETVKNIHPSLPLDDGRLHVLLGACGSLSVLKLKMLIKKLEDVYGGQKKVAIQVIVTDNAERLLYKRHQERQLMKEQKELKQQKMSSEQQALKDETPELLPAISEKAPTKQTGTIGNSKHSLDLPPHIQVWKDSDEWDVWQSRTDPVLHIELRRWADILVVAPMTANTLSKIALGLCDNLLTNVIRAWNPSSPILLAPSMVSQSYNSVITKRHLKFIKDEMPWITVFKPAEKIMGVHGDIGLGGMMDPHEIVNKIVKELGISDDEEDEEEEEEEEEEEVEEKKKNERKEEGEENDKGEIADTSKNGASDKNEIKDQEKSGVVSSVNNRVTLKKDPNEEEEEDDDDDSDDYDDDDDDDDEEDEEDEDEIMDEEDELDEFEIEQKEKQLNAEANMEVK
ncbi:flavo protein-domain-containing protein [Hanseniaspora valbyensis NRRL Y-1626]|uniref:Flavo protein-domain-containing protein n=1 Tax=Hanseniaspora valbyensis NRRL Y-1626 TaxID=766949 RepID=A0A1B7TD71_9ASCO|nr:flavo protein-domain-containing protein [Hanseniaspora valbyensis NRRL Y-1626]